MKIGMLDYGMGNLKSVSNAFSSLNINVQIITDSEKISSLDKLIIPGVGAFSEAISNLKENGLFDAVIDYVKTGKYTLGICLGMQLICSSSEEGGLNEGFDFIKARVMKFDDKKGFKIPHMGWNSLEIEKNDAITESISSGADVYFVHSYFVRCKNNDDIISSTNHSNQFASIIRKDNVYGMQFHPEKSQHIGLKLLENFIKL